MVVMRFMTNEVDVLLRAVRDAGDAIIQLQKSGFSVEKKSNHDVVTEADLLANAILKNQLLDRFQGDGWLSEESVDDLDRLARHRVWIVDPIDGTLEFVAGIPEYAISVALVENGSPILACVFNPAANELFHAIKGGGAWQGNKKLHSSHAVSSGDFLLLASRSEYKRGEWDQFKQHYRIQQVGSIAYKLALVAAGKADATFSLSPKNEWDIAAGVLLVSEAGGIVTNKQRETILFNRKSSLVDGIVATSADKNDAVFTMIENRK